MLINTDSEFYGSLCWCAAASVMGPNHGAQRDMSSCSVRDDLNVD